MLTASLQENEYQGVTKAKVSVENTPVQPLYKAKDVAQATQTS